MANAPFCALPQLFSGANAQGRAQWPKGHVVTIGVRDPFPGFSVQQTESVIKRAIDDIELVCGVKIAQLTTGRPNIVIQQAALGTTGVLAQAQLPWPGTQATDQLWAQFNTQVRFVDASNPSAQSFPIMPVFQHECWGHNLGLGHEQTPAASLMDPSIGSIQKFTPQDPMAGELVARYGLPGSGDSGGTTEDSCPMGAFLRCAGLPEESVQSATRNWSAFVQQIKNGLKVR